MRFLNEKSFNWEIIPGATAEINLIFFLLRKSELSYMNFTSLYVIVFTIDLIHDIVLENKLNYFVTIAYFCTTLLMVCVARCITPFT